MTHSKWGSIGTPLMMGLFVAYIDRTNLSVAMPSIARDLGFAGAHFAVRASWALTIFLIGYALANILGGILTRRHDAKTMVIWCMALWSLATVVVGFTGSFAVLLICRLALGVAEGVYWPQQSRFAQAWFAPEERSKANAVIQYYGQFLALAVGFMMLTPIYDAFGWRVLFVLTGGVGLIVIVPLYMIKLRPDSEAPFRLAPEKTGTRRRPRLADLGGPAFLLLLFSYITQGMLFWGITLWIPLAVRSLGFTGVSQAMASALPYAAAVVLAVPMTLISDRTGMRVLVAALGLLLPGLLMVCLPLLDSGGAKLALITVALGYYAASYSPNIWSILQSSVEPRAVGPAAGLLNGIGAGGGGTLAGFLVGLLTSATGSYMSGFIVLGGLVILGGLALLAYGRVMCGRPWIQGRRDEDGSGANG